MSSTDTPAQAGTDPTTATDAAEAKPSIDQLQSEVAQHRDELAETVEALSAKMDVKGRTKARLADTRQQAAAQVGAGRARATELVGQARSAATTPEGKPTPATFGVTAALAAVVAATSVLVWRRRR